jgi:preprotein translocase subunit SecA
MAEREAKLAKRERELSEAEDRVRRWSQHLRDRERQLEVGEWRVEVAAKLATKPTAGRAKTGRNERCPCRSGLKYKHCHGLPGRRR